MYILDFEWSFFKIYLNINSDLSLGGFILFSEEMIIVSIMWN